MQFHFTSYLKGRVMMKLNFTIIKSLTLLVAIAALAASISAQENDSTAKKKRRGPLPFFFGKIGVDDDQREALYDIQDSYDDKIKILRLEMKKLLAERDAAMEATLTPGQKLRLSELKAEAVNNAKKGTGPAKKKEVKAEE